MDNPVGVPDVVNRFRPLNDVETALTEHLLVDAWEELLAPGKVPDLEARVASGLVRPGLVTRVVTAMVIRVLRNPEAIRQWQVDDATFTRDSLVSSGLLFVSDDEVGLLTGGTGGQLPPLSFSAPYRS